MSDVIKHLKGESAVLLFRMHPELRKRLWKGNLWSAGKFYRSVGNVTADTIKHYINESQHKPVAGDGQEQSSLRHFLG
jgi:putative transposase